MKIFGETRSEALVGVLVDRSEADDLCRNFNVARTLVFRLLDEEVLYLFSFVIGGMSTEERMLQIVLPTVLLETSRRSDIYIHPPFKSVLYETWSTLVPFQLLMVIMPGSARGGYHRPGSL